MINTKRAMSALATGLLASLMLSSSATAQKAAPVSGWTPGQPFVVSVSTSSGIPLMVVAAGQIPLEADARVEIFLIDLTGDGGPQELVYTLSIEGESSLESSVKGKRHEGAGNVHSVILASPASGALGAADPLGGSVLVISADGMQHTIGHDLSDDIVWDDPCVFGGHPASGMGSLSEGAGGELSVGDGVGTLTATTSTGGSQNEL